MCEMISKEQAQEVMDEAIRIDFKKITRSSKNNIRERRRHTTPTLEVEWVIRSLALDTIIPASPGMPKLYKGKGNPRPCIQVIAVVGSPFH